MLKLRKYNFTQELIDRQKQKLRNKTIIIGGNDDCACKSPKSYGSNIKVGLLTRTIPRPRERARGLQMIADNWLA